MAKKSLRSPKKDPEITLKDALAAVKLTFSLSLKAGKKDLIITTIIRLIESLIPALTAILAGQAVNELIAATTTHELWPTFSYIITLFGISALQSIILQYSTYREQWMYYNTVLYVERAIAEKYASLPIATRETKEFSDLFDRVRDYSYSVRWIFNSLRNIVANVISFTAAFLAMFWISPLLAVIVVIAVIPYAILDFRQTIKERNAWKERTPDRRKSWAINNFLVTPSSAIELKINGLTDHFIDNVITLNSKTRDDEMKLEKAFYAPKFGLNFFDNLINHGALAYVVWQIILGKIPVGQFVTIRSLLGNLSSSARSFFSGFANISRELLNANDFTKFMNLPAEENGSIILDSKTPPKIEFQNVSFTYQNSNKQVLSDVSFTVNPGEDIAIVGENGAGKTTIVKLLIGIYQPTKGQILINGTPLNQLDRKSWAAQLSALFQNYSRYDFANLEENIWYGDITKDPSVPSLEASLQKAGLESLPGTLPKGYKQVLNKDLDKDFSIDLSGGQWQRLALARNFFRDSNILILDEPTSAVDAKAEYQIFQEIIKEQKDKTTIIISHRFSTVRKASRIIVLESGKIVESGTHHQLIANSGLYRTMFDLQAEGYRD